MLRGIRTNQRISLEINRKIWNSMDSDFHSALPHLMRLPSKKLPKRLFPKWSKSLTILELNAWSVKSSDLTACEFLLCGYHKRKVHAHKSKSFKKWYSLSYNKKNDHLIISNNIWVIEFGNLFIHVKTILIYELGWNTKICEGVLII